MYWIRAYEIEEFNGRTHNEWFGYKFSYELWYRYNNSGEEFKENKNG